MRQGEVIAERFELERFVARGGMGDVWRARDRVSGAQVALKLLTVHYPQLVKRLTMEARALTDLDHPAIVKYVAHETDEQRGLYLAMEWLEGVTLSERLRTRPLTVDESLSLAGRIAEGLGLAHSRGMVHRDVKPLNIFLPGGRAEQAKILDFGIVRLNHFQQITATGVGMGTPEYMAPEQARCEREIGPEADVFALGCVLYRCITGRPAFRGRRIEAVLAKIAMVDQMPRVGELKPDTPAEVDQLVSKMMAYDPARRPRDGGAAARHIHSVREAVQMGHEPTARVQVRRALTRDELEPVAMIFADLALGEADTLPSGVLDLDSLVNMEMPDMPSDGEAATMEISFGNVKVMRGPSDANRALPAVRRALEPYGARAELLLNGSVVAMVSGGVAATDMAVRTARAALAIRAILPDAAIGVASGRAVAQDRGDLGPIIDAAAALVRPKSREIWMDRGTVELLPPRFQLAAHKNDGKRVELVEERLDFERPGEAPRKLLGRDTPCVGRNRLLRQLAAAFDGSVEDRAAEAIVVVGDAGVGKSRFRAELVGRVEAEHDPVTVVAAWGDPFRSKAPYGLLGRALRGHLGVPDADITSQRNLLRAAVRDRVEPSEVERLTEFLGELTGVRFPDETSARLRAARRDPELMAEQIRRAFEDWLSEEAINAPVLFVVDDLQWADDASVALIASGLKRCAEQPLVVLALGRPEVHDRFPGLGDDWNRQEIVLDALRASDCQRLVDEALGAGVDPAVRDSIIERSAGNAFYLEELIRAAAAGETDRLPDTVLASVQLRVGRLPEGARQVLRAASVFGRRFWPAGVGELLDSDITPEDIVDWLGLLQREELVLKVSAFSGLAGEAEYVFRHDLTREAAYVSLTEEDRETGHRLAGSWLEEAGERDAIVLAEHFAGGGAAGRAVEWFEKAAEQALAERDETDALESLRTAGRHLIRAGETAAGSYANETAIAMYERAVALLGTLDSEAAIRARVRLAQVRERVGQRELASKELAESLEWIQDGDPMLKAEVLLSRANLEMRSRDAGALENARRAAVAARDLASRAGRQDLEARALTTLAGVLVQRGSEESSRKAAKYAERALLLQRQDGDVAISLWRLGNAFLVRNELDRATSAYRDAEAAAKRIGDELLSASCFANMGMVAFRRWRIADALKHTERALGTFERIGHRTRVAEMMLNLGTFHQFGGDSVAARPYLEKTLSVSQGDWVLGSLCYEGLAELERHEGNEAEAQAHLRAAAKMTGQVAAVEKQAFYLGLLAESLWSTGEFADAATSLEQALEVGGGVTMSHGLLMERMGQFERATNVLSAVANEEPDPDRRLIAELALTRLALFTSRVEDAAKHCESARHIVPDDISRYALPVKVLASCIADDATSALDGLSTAQQICAPYIFAELCVDVGELIARCSSEAYRQRYADLASGATDRGLRFRIEFLRGLALSENRRASEAEAAFDLARREVDDMFRVLPEEHHSVLMRHPWIADVLRPRLL